MTDMSFTPSQSGNRTGKIVLRWALYIMLGVFALFYLMPLFVMS
jgi:glucose/mannose transport system permease protein